MHRPCIKNYTLPEAEALFESLNERTYRARQLFNWLYERNVETFDAMTDFSKDLRRLLDERYCLNPLSLADRIESTINGTQKFLFETRDGEFIESVLLRGESDDDRTTICVSSQVGCAMGCRFCRTASIGFRRNLGTAEILDQLCQVRRLSGIKNDNVVFMGMGEPFMNYDNVLAAAAIMNYSFGFHISVRRITISTCGITDAIERYIDEKKPYNLAISLNDTVPEKRKAFMPVENRYPADGIRCLLEGKFPVSRNRVTIEYVMRTDNISADDARRLKRMFRHSRIKLNLIRLNAGDHGLVPPSDEEVGAFIKELEIMNVPINIRKSAGSDIGAACGQLAGQRYHTRKALHVR
jgi:23S rRNA (adenine2503-C2)-methyltransferase